LLLVISADLLEALLLVNVAEAYETKLDVPASICLFNLWYSAAKLAVTPTWSVRCKAARASNSLIWNPCLANSACTSLTSSI
jgi:hypothetical protein